MHIGIPAILVSGLMVLGCTKDAGAPCDEGFRRDAEGVCRPDAVGGSDVVTPGMDTGAPTADDDATDQEEGWQTIPSVCEAPAEVPSDPVVLTRYAEVAGFAHVLDAAYNEDTDQYYLAGIPALTGWRVTETGLEETVRYDAGSTEHVTILGPDRVAVSRRGDASRRGMVEILAVDDFQILSLIPVDDAAGMRTVGDYLYILTSGGSLYTYDITDVAFPTQVHHMTGLSHPWDLEVVGTYAYVADNTDGLVILDMSNPQEPAVHGVAEGIGGLQDVVVADGYAYGAAGSRGVEIFSLADPAMPVSLGVVDPGGGSQSVAVGEQVLWVANQVGVAAIDVRDPTRPQVMGSKSTGSWAMAVASSGPEVFLAGWAEVAVYEADTGIVAPDARPDLSALYFPERTTEQVLRVHNAGADTLEITGLRTEVPGVDIRIDEPIVEPGSSAKIRVQWSGSADLSGRLCIASNDPDEPVQYLDILTRNNDSSVLIGESAPDFVLPGLDGQNYTLSAQRGQPVLLIYFAAW